MKLIKNLFNILKGFGFKKYLLIMLNIILILSVIFGVYYLAGSLFTISIPLGIISIIIISAIIILLQLFIVNKTKRN